jgi:hypothetical protein
MRIRVSLVLAIVCLSGFSPALAQFRDGDPGGATTGKSQVAQWRTGMIVKASGGPCRGLTGYVPVPTDWPEQQVTTVNEEVSPEARISYETVDGGVRIMNVRIAQLAGGQEAKALVTVEIRRHAILPPDDTDIYVLPNPKKLPRQIRPYLLPSPKIESRDPKIRDLARKIGADKEKAWEKVEAIYDWVREKVKYKTGHLKGALAALRDGAGDCEEITSLFIAICRAADIPARTVWVSGHCYPEFYLDDDKGKGHWFPCQSAGAREFGGISELRPIMQKGDSFRPPKNSRERQRYMAEYLTGSPSPGGGQPQVKFIREPVAK